MESIQREIDVRKWLESEAAQRDLCGSYLFCKHCDKSLPYPCAQAYKKMQSISSPKKNKKTSSKKSKYNRLTFEQKVNRAEDDTKEILQSIIDEIETDEIKATIYKRFLSVKYNNRLCAWISYNRKILRVHLPLNPDSYQEYKPQNFSTMKTYENNPYTLKLNTKRSLKAIRILINKVVKDLKNKN